LTFAPVRVRAPRRRVEDDPDAGLAGDLEVGPEVVPQRTDALLVVEQDERGEVRQLEPLVEDQRRLHAAVGDERGVRQLRQALPQGHRRDDTDSDL
jgi:hypothetical protein